MRKSYTLSWIPLVGKQMSKRHNRAGLLYALSPLNVILLVLAYVAQFLYGPLTVWAARLELPAFHEILFIDNIIPYVPVAIVPYLSMYVFVVLALVVFVLRRDRLGLTIYLLACTLVWSVSNWVYVVFPTAIILRPAVPGSDFFGRVVAWFYENHSTYGAFISGHNSSAALAASGFASMRTRFTPMAVLWAASICISTWLVKQHYVLDSVGSVTFALAVYWVCSGVLQQIAKGDASLT